MGLTAEDVAKLEQGYNDFERRIARKVLGVELVGSIGYERDYKLVLRAVRETNRAIKC